MWIILVLVAIAALIFFPFVVARTLGIATYAAVAVVVVAVIGLIAA